MLIIHKQSFVNNKKTRLREFFKTPLEFCECVESIIFSSNLFCMDHFVSRFH